MSVFNSEDGIEEGKTVKIIGNSIGQMPHGFAIGSLVRLYRDGGSDAPRFIDEKGLDQYVHLNDVEPVE
jgi:hypothetical protein